MLSSLSSYKYTGPLVIFLLQSFLFPHLLTMAMAAEAHFHVLAVDDNLMDRKLIERLLKISSYQVTVVDSGSKALEFLGQQDEQRNQPWVSSESQEMEVNLIITDYCMPGMTGYDLLRKIKESSSLRDIPVVIMSSDDVPSRINRCLEEGAEEFFLKPVQLSDMNKLRPHLLKGKSKELQQQPTNKRKATDEDLSPNNTRQRFRRLTFL